MQFNAKDFGAVLIGLMNQGLLYIELSCLKCGKPLSGVGKKMVAQGVGSNTGLLLPNMPQERLLMEFGIEPHSCEEADENEEAPEEINPESSLLLS